MPTINVPGKDVAEQTKYVYGFQQGLNKLQDESLISDHELSDALNNIIVVDGLQKRLGSLNFGSSSGSRIYGAASFYTSAAANNRWMLREGGTSLMYYTTPGKVPTAISGATMTAGKRTEFAEARDTMYVENGTDPLTKIIVSGVVPTAVVFTALSTPTNLTVTPTGTAGSTHYSYRITAFSATGETLACTSVPTTTGNATLTATNYNALAWTAVSNAVGYNIYGRKATTDNGIGETKMATITTNAYNDTGVDTPSTIITPPEGNSSGGQVGSMVFYAMSRLFVAGDPGNPSRLYYSGVGTSIDDFSTAYSGGWVDVSKNDGDSITGIFFFQNAFIVWKHHSIWKFTFTTAGLPQLELITNEIGCESFRTIRMVNNDIWFVANKDGRAVVFSLGNVQQYFNALRTTEQSLKISGGSLLDSTNLAYLANSCAFYFRNLYLLAVPNSGSTTNNRIYAFDSRFSAWAGYWEGMNVNSFFTYTDVNNQTELYYADETSGYVVQMFTGTNDNGTAIHWRIQTKSFMLNYFDQYKIFRNPILWFKDVANGTITGYFVLDGLFSSGTFNITALVSGIGAGFDKMGTFKAGDSLGASTTSLKSDQPMEIITTKQGRSLKMELDDTNASSSFKFLGFSFRWLLLAGKPLPSENRIRL